MSYDFLKKAQLQPDLNDFCEYLKKPLSILEEIQIHYKKLQLTKKVEPSNLETYHKVDVILEKHLPEMVDTYCDFSFDYRNSKSININDISLTPKELLLKNLAKVIEEIEIIEADFNRNNSFNAVVQNKILEDYGHKPQLCLESGKVVSNNLQLDNKFDYEEFTKNNQFKKPNLSKAEIPKKEDANLTQEASRGVGMSAGLLEIIMVLGLVVILATGTMTMYSGTRNAQLEQLFQYNILRIQEGVHNLYVNRPSVEGLNNKILIESGIVSKEQLILPWEEHKTMNVTSTSLDRAADSMLIEVPLNKDHIELSCNTTFIASNNFDMVKVGNLVVKNDSGIDASSFLTACLSGEHKTVTLIDKM